ncbi:hypothetical protein [Hymenobacter ruricola]|uniref:Uncharacterized protein n=1 Tax=Hymenobacter ruricola TaxID=2791023 RepID=A0ABS0I835_9BACT|nr:hypothetical protein [Hymenobacter ruricola]MBF9222689.1 hypothetical protein [Hymenobacter ruricola]
MPADSSHVVLFAGPFDYAAFAVLVLANAWYARRPGAARPKWWAKPAVIVLFVLVLPLLSMRAEMVRTLRPPGTPTDAFELLYTMFRFPIYWFLLAVQTGVFNAYSRRKRLLFIRRYRLKT